MKIENSYYARCYSNNTVKQAKPSFEALHPSRYYLKNMDGTFTQITDPEVIKDMQRTIIGMLNKLFNDHKLRMSGKTPKAETVQAKTTRERLMSFFINNDLDYRERKVACSFYDTRHNGMIPYIITGNQVEEVVRLAKPIGQLKAEINREAAYLSKKHKISIPEAKRIYLGSEENALYNAQSNYYTTLHRHIDSDISPEKGENTLFDAFFDAVTKRNKVKYELVNAEFKHKMI